LANIQRAWRTFNVLGEHSTCSANIQRACEGFNVLTIGKIAREAGVSVDTIRYYERVGLLPKPTRTAAGYRMYSLAVINRLALVKNAQRFGFPLRAIAGFLRVRESGGKPCHDVRAAAERMLEAVDRQIADLVAARRRMRTTLKSWDEVLARTPADRPARLLERLGR
jgi:DNA-binding transcriptional MerR regulator